MRTKLFTFLLLFASLTNYAQRPQRCDVSIPDHVFRQKQKSVVIQPSEDLKLQVATAITINNCLSVKQIKSIAVLFIDDFNRLDFVKSAWHSAVDKENFYFIYDDFAYFSTVFMLHDYIQTMESHPTDYFPPSEQPVNLIFPPFDFPSYENYHGPSNCNYPVREDEFLRLAAQVTFNKSETTRMLLLTQITQNSCLSVTQAMKLASLLAEEPNRLSFFKTAYMSLFDLNNLPFGDQLFDNITVKAAYNEFISMPVVPPPCKISPDEFTKIKESIQKENFNSTKLTIAKQIVRSKQCFTTRQITNLVSLFSFDDTRLELAEFAWEFTIDKDNYYQIADALTFSSTKEKLMMFLKDRKK
ncbi:MAG: DUF4476 domain-containing protein [Bacteroidota bacterium]